MRSTAGMLLELEDVGMRLAPKAKPDIEEILELLQEGDYEAVVREITHSPLMMFHGVYIAENQKLSLLHFILMTENIFLKMKCFEIASSNDLYQMYDATVETYQSSKHAKLFDRSTASTNQKNIYANPAPNCEIKSIENNNM